jgi:hypothetical protein
MFQIIETVIAITQVAKFPIGKAVTISGKNKHGRDENTQQ